MCEPAVCLGVITAARAHLESRLREGPRDARDQFVYRYDITYERLICMLLLSTFFENPMACLFVVVLPAKRRHSATVRFRSCLLSVAEGKGKVHTGLRRLVGYSLATFVQGESVD